MELFIRLSDLALLPDAAGISQLPHEEQVLRARRIFSYLPENSRVEVREGLVHVMIPEASEKEKNAAERHATSAARKARNGDYGKAKSLLKRALEMDPSLTDARRDLAMICAETGDHEEAKNHLIDVLRMNPEDAWSYVVLANHYSKEEDNKVIAENLLRKALELSPEDPWALNSMAAVAMEQGRDEEGLQCFQAAIRSKPTFPEAHFGKALFCVRKERFEEAETTLETLFANCPPQDNRSAEMFNQARTMYLRIENILANNQQAESKAAVDALRRKAEEASGYPVIESTESLSGSIVAQIRMAWKHKADHHRLVMAEGDDPAIIRHHRSAHELYHVLMESAGRDSGKNRWFVTGEANKQRALQVLEPQIAAFEQKGIPRNRYGSMIEDVIHGAAGLLYNCPLDMRIEKQIREEHPELKRSQFCSVFMLAQDARNATFNQKVRDIMPKTILRINDALNTAYALYMDKLFNGASDFADPYKKLPHLSLGKELLVLWEKHEAATPFGEEWRLVDALSEKLDVVDWYDWEDDRGFIPPETTNTEIREGVTNPDLLKEKAAPAAMYLLDALQRYAGMSPDRIRAVASEIALLGQEGIDYASTDKRYTLKSLPEKSFSGLHLMCLMYAGFKHVAPEIDTGMDLNDAYSLALEMYANEEE